MINNLSNEAIAKFRESSAFMHQHVTSINHFMALWHDLEFLRVSKQKKTSENENDPGGKELTK
jgi:hypothetical protein